MNYEEYGIRIPIELYGRDTLRNLLQSLQGVSSATRRLTADQKEFVSQLRDEVNAAQSLDKALKEIISGAAGFTESHRMMALALRAFILDLRHAEQQANTTANAIGRIGGRILGAEVLGRLGGIPGGGFIGSQLIYSLGNDMSRTALWGVGGAAVGALAGYGAYRAYDYASGNAQKYRNQAAELGISTTDAQMLTHISEVSGTQLNGITTVLHKMNEELLAGGPNSKKVAEGLQEIGLSGRIAFEDPITQLRTMMNALRGVQSEQERARLTVQLFGESGRQLLPLIDNFDHIAEAIGRTKAVMSKETIDWLNNMREQSNLIKLEWQGIWERVGGVAGIAASGVLDFLMNSGFVPGTYSGPPAPEEHASGRDVLRGAARATMNQRRVNAGVVYQYQIAQAERSGRTTIENLEAEKQSLEMSALTAKNAGPEGQVMVTTGNTSSMMPALDAFQLYQQRIRSVKSQIEYQHRYEAQLKQFNELPAIGGPSGPTWEQLAAEGHTFEKQFSLLKGLPAYQQRLKAIRAAENTAVDVGATSIGDTVFNHLIGGFAKDRERNDRDLAKFYAEDVRDIDSFERAQTHIARGTATSATHAARVASAIRSGFNRYGLTPSALSRMELSTSLTNIGGDYTGRETGINAEINALKAASLKYELNPSDEAARHKQEIDAQILQKQSELESARNDAITKSIDAVNRFNESVTKAAEEIRSEVAHGLTSIIMGAQSGGARGARRALGSFVTGQEGHLLNNVFEHMYDTQGVGKVLGKIGGGLPDWLTKGTILSHTNDPIKLNTDATTENTKATLALTTAMLGGGGGGGGATGGPGGTGHGGVGGALSQIYGSFKRLASRGSGGGGGWGGNAAGNEYGDIGSLSEDGIPITENSIPGMQPEASGTGSGEAGGGKGFGAYAAAGMGTAAGLYGVFTSGSTRGKISSGGGALMSAGAVVPGAAGWVMMGVGAAMTLAGMFMPDPREQRAHDIERTTFTQRYLAPEAIHMMAGAGGGYADYDIYGGVRTSHFSPYPIVSEPYLDVPRRTVVPGYTLSPFGGFQNVTGAMTPSVVHYHNWNVQSMDGRSFIENGHKIMDAINHELNSAYHPAVHTLAKQLGVR